MQRSKIRFQSCYTHIMSSDRTRRSGSSRIEFDYMNTCTIRHHQSHRVSVFAGDASSVSCRARMPCARARPRHRRTTCSKLHASASSFGSQSAAHCSTVEQRCALRQGGQGARQGQVGCARWPHRHARPWLRALEAPAQSAVAMHAPTGRGRSKHSNIQAARSRSRGCISKGAHASASVRAISAAGAVEDRPGWECKAFGPTSTMRCWLGVPASSLRGVHQKVCGPGARYRHCARFALRSALVFRPVQGGVSGPQPRIHWRMAQPAGGKAARGGSSPECRNACCARVPQMARTAGSRECSIAAQTPVCQRAEDPDT